MAPEVFEEKYSSKADIWSGGCIAMQMATGVPPWKSLGITNPVALFNHMKGTEGLPEAKFPTPTSDSAAKELEVFQKLLSKCFARDPKLRPDARALQSDEFFHAEYCMSEDEDDACSEDFRLLSPASKRSPGVESPMRAKHSPARRNSLGALRSPFLSPPLPKRQSRRSRSPIPKSPQVDPGDWPTWARNRHNASSNAKSPAADVATLLDSLALSDSSTEEKPSRKTGSSTLSSPLVGLPLLDSSSEYTTQPLS